MEQNNKLVEMMYNMSTEADRRALGAKNIDVSRLTKRQIDDAYSLMNTGWGLVEALESATNSKVENKDFKIEDLTPEDEEEEFGFIENYEEFIKNFDVPED